LRNVNFEQRKEDIITELPRIAPEDEPVLADEPVPADKPVPADEPVLADEPILAESIKEFRIKVSIKHLILTLLYFKILLTG